MNSLDAPRSSRSALFLPLAMFNKHSVWLLWALILLIGGLLAACAPPATPIPLPETTPAAGVRDELVLATTTSTYDSGLLDAILPDFEGKTGIRVRVVAVGTGQALELGRAGDADVVLVHARPLEDQFVAEGHAPARFDVMYNDFVIVGPPADPAGLRGLPTAAEAFTRLAEKQGLFISRGDNSGTHFKENELWALAGVTPQGDWYQSAGQGMGAVLTMADEQQAYTLSDRATYLARLGAGLDLEIMIEQDPPLRNPYGVLPINPEKAKKLNYGGAIAFVNWLTSAETQALIGQFGVDHYGQPLFFPNARK